MVRFVQPDRFNIVQKKHRITDYQFLDAFFVHPFLVYRSRSRERTKASSLLIARIAIKVNTIFTTGKIMA